MKILLLPGLDGTGDLLHEFVAALSSEFAIELITYPRERAMSYGELATLVEERIPEEENFVIIAESFSGPVATILASKGYKNLKCVVFVASFAGKPNMIPSVFSSLLPSVIFKSDTLLRTATPLGFGRWRRSDLSTLFVDTVKSVSPDVIVDRLRMVLKANEYSSLSLISVPVFYLRPTRDRLVSAKAIKLMRKRLPSIEVAEIVAPHFVLQVSPKASATTISRFIEQTSNDR